jgi:hypothetical protein
VEEPSVNSERNASVAIMADGIDEIIKVKNNVPLCGIYAIIAGPFTSHGESVPSAF